MEKKSEKLQTKDAQDKKGKGTDRRQFVAGVASLGAAGVLGSAMLTGDAGKVKSKILSRIQEQLKAEGGKEEGMVYDKGSHSRYLKETPPPGGGEDPIPDVPTT